MKEENQLVKEADMFRNQPFAADVAALQPAAPVCPVSTKKAPIKAPEITGLRLPRLVDLAASSRSSWMRFP